MRNKPNIWLLSAYRSDSHAAWANWLLETFNEINWFKLELPGRYFRWRIRGNPLSWLNQLPDEKTNEKPDLILATSMVDLATIKGLHPRLANVPCLYYFHENQFAYPVSKEQHDSVDPQMVQLYGALASNQLLFNSAYNQDSFLSGVEQLLKKLPDEVPENIINLLKNKCTVLPVPIKATIKTDKEHKNQKLILWNHRWEYDKAPEVFAEALILLKQKGIDFELALLGDRAREKPTALLQIEQQLNDHIIINQKVSREDYLGYLSQTNIVVSSAIHEFQGLSILEAVSAGATPLVPDDLCYREQYPEKYRYKSGSSEALSARLADWLDNITPEAPDVLHWSSMALTDQWRETLNTSQA